MGSVYLLGDSEKEGFFKIGVTRGDINKRIKKLQTGNAGEIYLVSYYETEQPFLMEKMLHTKFNGNKILNEWFSLTTEETVKFKDICEEIQKNINALQDNYFFQKKYGKK